MAKKAKDLNFEAALQELEEVTAALEAGDVSLEILLDKYKRGVLLSDFCLRELDQTQKAMDELLTEKNGKVETEPLRLKEDVEDV